MPALPRFPHAVSFRILLALVVAAGMVISESEKAFAVHAVFPGLIVDIDADTNGGAFTLLDDIDFTDEPGVDLAATNTFALTAPAGFEFNPAAAGDAAAGFFYGATDIDLGGGAGAAVTPVYSVGNTVATWTVTAAGVGVAGLISITGMELRPLAGKTVIVGDGTANVTIAGNVTAFDTPNAHPIHHVPGALANFLVERQGGGGIGPRQFGAEFNVQITARDQFNNTLNDGFNNFNLAGDTVDLTSNLPIGAGGGTTGVFTNGVLNNHGMVLNGLNNGGATITATDTPAAGLGTGVETGTSAPFTVGPLVGFGPAPAPASADEGTFDPATGTHTVDPVTGRRRPIDVETQTANGGDIRVTDADGTTVEISTDDLPTGTREITVSMRPASAGDVADALAEAGLPAGTMAFGVEIDIVAGDGTDIGGTTPVTVQFELPAGFDAASGAVVVNGEVIAVTVVSLGPPVVVEASLPHLTTVLFVEIVEEEAEEEPPAPEVLALNAGGQFLFWAFGAAQAADVFGTVKIAWLFDPAAVSWTSFIPALGITNFALSEGAVLWIVSETAQDIVLASGPVGGVGPGISIPEALTTTLQGPLLVNGFLVAESGEVRLCEALAESLPPQCGGASLRVDGFDLASLPDSQSAGGVTWSDAPIQILGTVADGVLTVSTTAIA